MNLRFGLNLLIYTAAFSKKDLDLIARAADLGYDGVEVLFGDLDVLDPEATRAALEAAGMDLTACAVMTEDANPCSPDPAVRRAAAARLRRIVDMTVAMGGKLVAGPLYAPVRCLTGRARTDDEWRWCRDILAAAAAHAHERGVTLAIEPLNRFETYVLTTVAEAVRMCREVDSPALKVQVDTFHANIEEKDIAESLRLAGPWLGHVHACENDRGVLGTGHIPWEAVFAVLRQVDYCGWVTIESFATGIVDLCAAACIWRPIYESADALAHDGLAFLKAKANAAHP
ncbi:MAG: sugar phosphate isomerase/epimerase [Lentisphaeria bacterium]|nr:sugar phosphate isomerase/epimerase [Lentisphaeria bacterium]